MPPFNGDQDTAKEAVKPEQPGLEPAFYPQPYQGYPYQDPMGQYQQPAQQVSMMQPQAMAPVAATPSADSSICGVRRSTFLLVLAIATLSIILVGVAVGLGVGLGLNQDKGSSNAATTTADTTPTPTQTLSSTPSVSATVCPQLNGTVTPELGVRYQILCDYEFYNSTKNFLAAIELPSFTQCWSLCISMNSSQNRTDIGASYNPNETAQLKAHACRCLGGSEQKVGYKNGSIIAVPQS